MNQDLLPGRSLQLGATVYPSGVNFCVFSRNCVSLELLLFDDADSTKPSRVIQFDSQKDKTFYYWHRFVPGLIPGQLYAYRAHGPFKPDEGHRFDGSKVLIDPYGRSIVVGKNYDRGAAIGPGDNCAYAMKSVVVDVSNYDWEGDNFPSMPYADTVIYELHVGGFTRHPSSGLDVAKRGTYLGLIEKIPYLQSLGITAVELLPVQQFDEQDVPNGGRNYWGYSPVAFFAPHYQYSSNRSPLGPINEFRDMVKAFHRAGIEIILDVVFNHTAEGNENGPTFCYRGLENRAYYTLEPDRTYYSNYSGCGNTLNANHSIVRRMILDCLRYWVAEMHVDGFRFDLASVLARDEWGVPLKSPPILWEIESDPVLADTKIIAEAWDAVGLYQVGTFVGHRWAEWNGQFRDDVRSFMRGDSSAVSKMAARLCASPDLYPQPDREPNRSINFVTCHDGFTLNDLVSYNEKHNEKNGENNQDGNNNNISWNCGIEGPSGNSAIEKLRRQQIKNFFTVMLIAQGTPMLLMGDEVRRTQYGNNNGYCQDNELSWFDWTLLEQEASLLRFVQGVIRFTQAHPLFREERFWTEVRREGNSRIAWHGVKLNQPDWGENSHSIALCLNHNESGDMVYLILNAYWEPLTFDLPLVSQGRYWKRIIDTSLESPDDFCAPSTAPLVNTSKYTALPRSSILLFTQHNTV